jgi:hypothetical protein
MTLNRILLTMAFGLCFMGEAAAEQGCPPGFFPGGMQPNGAICVPIPGYSGPANVPAQQPPEPQWESRWGAFAAGASGHSGGVLGVAAHNLTEQQAREAALVDCAEKGGKGCQLTLVFHDQCGAVAWGDQRVTAHGAATIEVASTLAMKRCAEIADNCSIYYTDCSYAERTQ